MCCGASAGTGLDASPNAVITRPKSPLAPLLLPGETRGNRFVSSLPYVCCSNVYIKLLGHSNSIKLIIEEIECIYHFMLKEQSTCLCMMLVVETLNVIECMCGAVLLRVCITCHDACLSQKWTIERYGHCRIPISQYCHFFYPAISNQNYIALCPFYVATCIRRPRR